GQPFNPHQQGRPMGAPNGQPFNPHQQARPTESEYGQTVVLSQQNRPEALNKEKPLVDNKPADTKPADTKPADTKPVGTKPTDTKPFDTKPADTKPFDTKPFDSKPFDTNPIKFDNAPKNEFSANFQTKPIDSFNSTTSNQKTETPAFMTMDDTQSNQPKPKRDIQYNYQALTPPDNKKTSLIIAVYVVVIIVLIIGVVGLASSVGSNVKDKFKELSSSVESAFADTDDYSDDSDSDSDMYISDNEKTTLRYAYIDSETKEYIDLAQIELYTPDEFEINTDATTEDKVVYYKEDSEVLCVAELKCPQSLDPEIRLNELFNSPSTIEHIDSYQYLEQNDTRRVLQVEFDDHTEIVALVDVNEEITLVIRALHSDEDLSEYSTLIDDVNSFADNVVVIY
ncbi:MAG: hypothetical protein UE295_01920, partial [Acutalibacteraceae bacterium]|nr:hypothetical protein [Acutalibacteraceae bacterium]